MNKMRHPDMRALDIFRLFLVCVHKLNLISQQERAVAYLKLYGRWLYNASKPQ